MEESKHWSILMECGCLAPVYTTLYLFVHVVVLLLVCVCFDVI